MGTFSHGNVYILQGEPPHGPWPPPPPFFNHPEAFLQFDQDTQTPHTMSTPAPL